MKIGVITDIHNNVVALKAVLKKFEAEEVDGIICCGDMIGIGPYPEETVQMMRNIPNLLACVVGNHERYLTEGTEGMTLKQQMSDGEKAQHKWEHTQLSAESSAFLHSFKYEKQLEIDGKIIHIIHYAMNEANNYLHIRRNPELNEIETAFENIKADVILYGHVHNKSILKGSKYFINPGSVGCPGKDLTIARAGILTIDKEIDFSEIAVEYDVAKVIEKIDDLGYPDSHVVKRIFYGIEEA